MISAKANNDGTVDLVGKQGTTWDLEISVFQDTAGTIPFDLTGYNGRGQFRKDHKLTSPILLSFTCTVLPYHAVDNPQSNKVRISAIPSQSSSLNTMSGVYDIEVFKDELTVERILEGKLSVTPEVTRDA